MGATTTLGMAASMVVETLVAVVMIMEAQGGTSGGGGGGDSGDGDNNEGMVAAMMWGLKHSFTKKVVLVPEEWISKKSKVKCVRPKASLEGSGK
ncbi:hypothetical protein RJT34_17941 [Clitoria ternatea]|uniref:Uncharacterized protein n=1 Tax=Clitoria ternatea TaxID=43366 RepID=A0AAN9PDR8_CLITE